MREEGGGGEEKKRFPNTRLFFCSFLIFANLKAQFGFINHLPTSFSSSHSSITRKMVSLAP